MAFSVEQYKTFIEPLCAASKRKRCHDYSNALQQARQKAAPDSDEHAIISLFEAITSYYLKPDSPGEAFGPMFVLDNRRSPIPADLKKEHREYLAAILPSVADPEMRARIADTLWELKHGQATTFAAEAVKAYLEAARISDDESWTFAAEHYARALRIYATMKRADKDGEIGIAVADEILKATNQAIKSGPPYLTMRLINLIRNARMPEAKDLIPAATELAEKFEAENNFNAAHDAWLLVSRLYHDADQPDEVTKAAMRAAETHVKLADMSEHGGSPDYMFICSWLESAVAAFRKIKGGKDRADELYLRLTSLQPRIHDQMQRFSFEVDLKEPIEAAINHVSDRTAIGAIMSLAFYRIPTPIDELRDYAAEKAKAGPLAAMLAGTYHNKSGHVVARKGINEPEENKLHRMASEIRKMQPAMFIAPALAQIRFEHNVSLQSWIDFLHSHPFVPESSRLTYALGLYHGLNGDYVAACHILVPQVENSLRHMLKEMGEETSKLNAEGLQEEKTLTQLLAMPALEKRLGKNLVFDIQGLLDEKVGDNFRHLLLHGLLDDDALDSALPIYFYWLVLHMIFAPLNREGLDLGKKTASKKSPKETTA